MCENDLSFSLSILKILVFPVPIKVNAFQGCLLDGNVDNIYIFWERLCVLLTDNASGLV